MVQIATITTMPSSTNAAPAPVKEFITAPVSKIYEVALEWSLRVLLMPVQTTEVDAMSYT